MTCWDKTAFCNITARTVPVSLYILKAWKCYDNIQVTLVNSTLNQNLQRKMCLQLKVEATSQSKTEPKTLYLRTYDKFRKPFYLCHMFLEVVFPSIIKELLANPPPT